MPSAVIRHQCWNHESREAVCRCPACGHSYCRECVTEHQARLLCASCLRKILSAGASSQARRVPSMVLLVAGLLFTWIVLLVFAGGMSEISARMEQAAWQAR